MRFLQYNLGLWLGILLWHAPLSFAQDDLQITRTGAFTHEAVLRDMVTPVILKSLSQIYGPDQHMSWNIYVPPDYNPQNPPGVLVYISPSKESYSPRGWQSVISDHNYIFISANGAGNKVPANRRMANAVLAVDYIEKTYVTDKSRTVISGFSGGAAVSSIIVETVPDIFEAAIFMGGASKWQGDRAAIHPKLENGAYVFITGHDDFERARRVIRTTYRQYKEAGVSRLKLIDKRNMGHELPKSKIFRQALDFIAQP